MTQSQESADGRQVSAWEPLRSRVYRSLFIAQLVSNIGTWMQNVAAQWFLVEKHSSDVIVALVQTASLGPTLLFALFAGVLANLFDRRRLLIVLQTYAVLVALALAVLTYLDRVSPTALLMFTVAIGCASALAAPAWQAIQPEVVPREQIPAVSTLGSVSGNASRAIGPAMGGVILAVAGPAAVFAINAISFAGWAMSGGHGYGRVATAGGCITASDNPTSSSSGSPSHPGANLSANAPSAGWTTTVRVSPRRSATPSTMPESTSTTSLGGCPDESASLSRALGQLSTSISVKTRRKSLPVALCGSSSMNTTSRGTL